ncbi:MULTISPECIES: Gfo/Idh/MocA family protein [unclassified Rothia (in: high G+C Gram-positive bacteria)]|uniref:Gfo/Idh/MocA family protein n=1 Tax=unclassified Rothia (in: high G+C Gram-positive bacteria) TaxID=2689056 RepID=UPI0019596A75|nr:MULTISPECIES: Gfo/Idh/MocA family oxidoreductase [unclassified Rothia (in: high G+C Gram-positive bacteria)]MBM7051368.1 Gfo/Idh/MocA family oxidoreductase [Rothia sp. ZJ1223]QRZ61162.1 Gfo/Idh/MocA family oxidoreductase [Rothia sp. ZJ932]
MLRLGIIGTGFISQHFIEASRSFFEPVVIMSRSRENAQELAKATGIDANHASTIGQLLTHSLDAVYIASPNSLHAEHTLAAIDAGVHPIVEKPAFWNPAQWESVHRAADTAGVLVLEAARNMYEPGMTCVIEEAQKRKVTSACFTYAQYSSRWDALTAGQIPNIFSLDFGGGALVDLGVYAVYTAIACFGEPSDVSYKAVLAPSGVDAHGTLVLTYPTFDVTIRVAKDYAASSPAEIYAGRERLVFTGVNDIRSVELVGPEHSELLFTVEGAEADTPRSLSVLMAFEAQYFAQLIQSHKNGGLSSQQLERYAQLTEVSRLVNEICTRARHDAGIFFTGEK